MNLKPASPRAPRKTRLPGLAAALPLVLLVLAAQSADPAAAQSGDPAGAASDTTAAAPADSLAAPTAPGGLTQFTGDQTPAAMAAAQAQASGGLSAAGLVQVPFFHTITNRPTAGIKSDVRVNRYYGELGTTLGMEAGSTFTNTASYSWDAFRQQDKTIEARGEKFTYSAGKLLPFTVTSSGSWDWSEDQTTNNAGLSNLSKRDLKLGSLRVNQPKFDLGPLKAILNSGVAINDQKSTNQNQRNDFSEASLDGGGQLGARIAPGVMVATRAYGKTLTGDRTLGENKAPSSATGDSLGAGIYFQRSFTTGRLAVTRSNFDKKYLDYKRNSTGQIDTVGLDEFDKVIDELETQDAVTVEFENKLRLGRLGLNASLSHSTDELAYRASGVGSKERQTDDATFALTYDTGNDSLAVTYTYLWKWDDQRIKNATENRGRQYIKNRDLDIFYGRRLFRRTDLTVKLHTGLSQDIAQFQFNTNDKDRLRNDVTVEVEREWLGKFTAGMLFSFKQSEEIAIRSTRSSNNNVKDSFEVSPSINWPLASWLTVNQTYRVYIQYTDYTYSELESAARNDDYNKRGNLNTIVVIHPTDRLELAVRHDYNKRSSATRTFVDATGNTFYSTDQTQAINKIDLGVVFRVVDGVTLEAATFRTRDYKEIYGATTKESEVFSGQMWVGAKINRKLGQTSPLEISAVIKKFNAFGPSVTDASGDYWEADAWVKWEF